MIWSNLLREYERPSMCATRLKPGVKRMIYSELHCVSITWYLPTCLEVASFIKIWPSYLICKIALPNIMLDYAGWWCFRLANFAGYHTKAGLIFFKLYFNVVLSVGKKLTTAFRLLTIEFLKDTLRHGHEDDTLRAMQLLDFYQCEQPSSRSWFLFKLQPHSILRSKPSSAEIPYDIQQRRCP